MLPFISNLWHWISVRNLMNGVLNFQSKFSNRLLCMSHLQRNYIAKKWTKLKVHFTYFNSDLRLFCKNLVTLILSKQILDLLHNSDHSTQSTVRKIRLYCKNICVTRIVESYHCCSKFYVGLKILEILNLFALFK